MVNVGFEVTALFDQATLVGLNQELLSRISSVAKALKIGVDRAKGKTVQLWDS